MLDKAELTTQLQARYKDIKKPEVKSVMRIQDEILSALRDHLRGVGFIEILAPIIGPATDPGIRGASQVSFDYYGTTYKIMSSMILYKQMAVNSFDRVFALSPNIRLEPDATRETGRHLTEFRQLDLEIANASYFDAMAYCSALTQRERQAGRLPPDYEYRLPTEAEWEHACRAGTTNQFSFGDAAAEAEQYAWTWENSDGSPHPVGLKRPNPWGLHDIHGNVWEWCFDWFGDYPAMDVTDPAGPAQGKFKVFRGGGWNNDALFARSANRFMMAPANGINFVGFRVALGPVRSP